MMKKLISTLFPMDNISVVPRSREKDLEVNGLPKGFVPVGGEIIEFGEETHGNMHRVHYLQWTIVSVRRFCNNQSSMVRIWCSIQRLNILMDKDVRSVVQSLVVTNCLKR